MPVLLALAAPSTAQLALPQAGPVLDRVTGVTGVTGEALRSADGTVADLAERASALARERARRLADLVRHHPEAIERDASGAPARKGELLIVDSTDEDLAQARAAGFSVAGKENLDELGLIVTRLTVPRGMSLAKAEAVLRKALPAATITADTLHFPAGTTATGRSGPAQAQSAGTTVPVGVIDGAPGARLGASAVQGFARGAPAVNDHASAVVSLLAMAGSRRILVADVYGSDPAGGNALAIGKGLDWLVGQGARVVTISLVGPPNPILAKAIAAAGRRGAVIVAAVGNDGPAAPPAYPASYPGVVAVTGVDGRNRALIEAGRALHLDYAAPGADMAAANAAGHWGWVRGTSYAAPLVAARAAFALERGQPAIAALDGEAVKLGGKWPDSRFGRGLVCGACRRRP